MDKVNIVSFSGGKDSTALLLWAKENLSDFEVVFCDTNWESPVTYKYIDYINETLLGGKLKVIRSSKYQGFEDLSIKRKRVPSSQARFCTQELKLFPMHDYIHSEYEGKSIELFVGIRREESAARSKMPERNFDMDYYGCWINRPLINWSADDVFNIHKKYNVEPNPLYKLGFSRVGCFPCVMCRHAEIRRIAEKFPERIEKIKQLETDLDRSFFPPDYIPKRFCSGRDEEGNKFPFVEDVVKYLAKDIEQVEMFEEPQSCMSYYNICE